MKANFKISFCFFTLLLAGFTNAQTLLQDLPDLKDGSASFLQSTYDRKGLNDDHITPLYHNYYDIIPQGKVNNPSGTASNRKEYVLCHVKGPAVLERFWMITFPIYFDARLRFYFDGETVPRLSKTFNELFFTSSAPFVAPLVQNFYASSGGFWSYIPMPVAKDLIVTIDTAAVFSQFGIRQLPADTTLQSWTFSQSNAFLVNEFNKAGNYLKDNIAQTLSDSVMINLLPGQTQQLPSISGKKTIEALKMQIPQLDYSYAAFVHDKGNFHKGTSKFTLKVNGNADTVLLIKRSNKSYHLDFNFSGLYEQASLKIDNQAAGTWKNQGYRSYRFWENDTIRLPKNLYQGKSAITLQCQYNSGEPWNEFYYWLSSDGVLTDSLDVGDSASESAHAYSVSNVQFNLYSELNNRYDAPAALKHRNRQILDSLYIRIYFDDDQSPSIDAPVGLFFGTGVNDAAYMQSLPCGNRDGEFYNFFSMPFQRSARIELENKSQLNLSGIILKTTTAPNSYTGKACYLKSFHNRGTKGYSDPSDYLVADFNGKGRYVGTVIEADQDNDTAFCWLEGDERIYVDDSRTPVFYGTGTEDYFNSTFYFYLDEYSLPQNGMTNSDQHYHRSMYRFHLSDPINFDRHLHFGIEHGDYNNKLGNYQSLAFAYLTDADLFLSDSLDPGNNLSELQHQYQAGNNKVLIQKSSAFEGEKYQQQLQQDGYGIADSVSFRVQVHPQNKGVRLLRTFDYSIINQEAEVWVNDTLAGTWLNAGANTISQLREDYFAIPQKYTAGRSSLKIRLVNKNPSSRWTEFYYKVYSLVDSSVLTAVTEKQPGNSVRIFPTLCRDYVFAESAQDITSFFVLSAEGKILRIIRNPAFNNSLRIDLIGLPAAVYLIVPQAGAQLLPPQKVVKLP